MSRIATFCDWVLRSPLIWGALAWFLFDACVEQFGNEWFNSYFTATAVHRITTAVFFIGVAALVIRACGVVVQLASVEQSLINPPPAGGQPASEAPLLLEQLENQPSLLRKTYLGRRMHDALEYVHRRQSADAIEGHLQSLEEADYARMSAGYAMVRVVTGVVPILGFLGTVIGITVAIGQLSPEQLESSLGAVTAGLSIAFDTTALALGLSIVLVFGKLFVERWEENLLEMVGLQVSRQLVGRFEQFGTATDPQVASISRMCDQVVRSTEVMAARQADLWKSTIDETNEHWAHATESAGKQLIDAVTTGLRASLEGHADGLKAGVEQQLSRLNESLGGQSDALAAAISSQVETLSTTVAAQVTALRDGVDHQAQSVADAVQGQISVINEVVARHGQQLDKGANDLLGNLRNGLERMAELLVEALSRHGETLTKAEEELACENRRHLTEVEAALGEAMVVAADRQEKLIGRSEDMLREMQSAVVDSASAAITHQEQLIKQGEVLLKVVESTGKIQSLEESLNRNLSSLGRTHNFEETLLSLSAAIQLLSARAGIAEPASSSQPVAKNAA